VSSLEYDRKNDDEETNVFWLAIVTANELGLAFPPRNLPKKFRPDPSTFYLVIVVTNRQTNVRW